MRPRLTIGHGGLLRAGRGGWRAIWIVRNDGASPVRIAGAWHPHGRFRSTRRSVDTPVRSGHFGTLVVPVRTDVRPRERVEDCFLILDLRSARRRWRVLARLTVTGRASRPPRVVVHAVDAYPATDQRRAAPLSRDDRYRR